MDVELAAKLDQSKKLTMTHQRVCEFIEVEVQMEEALDQLERTAEVVRRGDDLRRSAFEQALTAAGALIEAVAQLNEDGMLDDFVRTHRADGLHLGGDALSVSDTDIADDGGLAVTLFSRRVNQVVATIREYDSSKRRASRVSVDNSMQLDTASTEQEADEDPGLRELVDGFRSLIAEVHAEVQRELDTLIAIRQALPMDLLDENHLRQINQDALLDRLHVMDFGRFLAEHKERAEHMRLTKDAFKEKIQLLRDQHQSMLVDHEDSRSLKQANDELFRALSGLQLVFKSFQTETVEFRHIIMMLSVRHNSNAHKLKNKLNGSPATSASSSPKSRGERKDSATRPKSGAWVRKLKEGTLAQKDNKRTDGESPPPLANAALRKPSNAIDDCREREIVVKFGDNQGATVG